MTYGSGHYWASEDLNTTGENVGITLDSMCDIIAANDVTNGNTVVFVPGDIEHGEKGHFALGEGGGSSEIEADENVILVGDGENWARENVAKYAITLEASEEPEEPTEENPDPEPPVIDTAVIGTATPIIKLRSGVDTEEETFDGEIAARDKGNFCIQGGAKVHIGEKAVVFEGDDRGKFWNNRLIGPEIDIGACAKIEMNGNGVTPQSNATPTISMRGNCIIDMQDGSPYDYFGYSNTWKRGHSHRDIRNDIVRNMFNFVDEFQTGPVLQMKNRSVITMTHESILQMRHASTFIMEGNANFKCTSYGMGPDMTQDRFSEVLFGPNTFVQMDSQDPDHLAVLQVMSGSSSYNGQIVLSTALKDASTTYPYPATATDYSYYEFNRNEGFQNQFNDILSYRYPGTLIGPSPATYQGYWFLFPYKPMHVFGNAQGLLGSYVGESEALRQSYLHKPKGSTFVIEGNSTVNISGRGDGVVHIDKQVSSGAVYVEGCHMNNNATLIKENQLGSGSYVITQFNTDSNARALIKFCPDQQSDTFFGFTPSGKTSINIDPSDVCGINFQSLQTDIETKWTRFQGILEGNDSFVQMDGNTHLESWSSTVILRNSDPYNINSGTCYPNKTGIESLSQSDERGPVLEVPLDAPVDSDLIPFKRYAKRSFGVDRFNQYWMFKATQPTDVNLKFYSTYYAKVNGTQETIDYQQTDAQYASVDIRDYASDIEIASYEDLIADPGFIAKYQEKGIKDVKYDDSPTSSSTPYFSCTYNSSRNKYIINCYRYLKAASVGTGQDIWKGNDSDKPIKNTSYYYITYSKANDSYQDIKGYFGNHWEGEKVYFISDQPAYSGGYIYFYEDEGFTYKATTTSVQLSMEALPVTFNLANCTLTYYTPENVMGKSIQDIVQTEDFDYAIKTLLSFDENAVCDFSNATVSYTDLFHRDENFTSFNGQSTQPSHFGTVRVTVSNFSISNFTYLLRQIVSGSTYNLQQYNNQTITTSTVINEFCRLAGLNETMIDLSFNYSVSSCVTGQWYEKLAWQTDNPIAQGIVFNKAHLGKDWNLPIQTADRIGDRDWDKSPIVQAQGPANVMIRESMKEALKDSGLIYITTSTWISTKEQMYARPEYIAFVNSINSSTDKDYGGLMSFRYTQNTVSGNREWELHYYYTRKWTFTTTADEFDLTDNNAALYAFKNSSYYSTFIGDIESGYELDYIDYISQVDSTTYQIHYFAKEAGTTNHVESSGLAPVVEITDESELRLYGGAKIKAETECGETIVTITGASNEGSVSFTIAQLKALKALIS